LSDEFENLPFDQTEENIQARVRGVILMALSNKFGHLVLTTGNKSEMASGYATLYGDMAGGFAVLKDVAKTLVWRLARYRNQLGDADSPLIPERIITRPPSAELRADQCDQDSLPRTKSSTRSWPAMSKRTWRRAKSSPPDIAPPMSARLSA
jgi:NAD+ synthase (glutamine-hydrolysing)